jgi:hypothetical protein
MNSLRGEIPFIQQVFRSGIYNGKSGEKYH